MNEMLNIMYNDSLLVLKRLYMSCMCFFFLSSSSEHSLARQHFPALTHSTWNKPLPLSPAPVPLHSHVPDMLLLTACAPLYHSKISLKLVLSVVE
jgi:hypothetical protein